MYAKYQQVLEKAGFNDQITKIEAVSGGCINKTLALKTRTSSFFLKENTANYQSLFEKEILGLSILSEKSPLKVPEVFGCVSDENFTYLLLELIEKGHSNTNFWKDFGHGLASQHKQGNTNFGLSHDNHIGRLDQSNSFHESWTDFFIEERLLPQIELAEQKHLIGASIRNQFDSLFTKFDQLIPTENPSLLHGDLWSGNFLCAKTSESYIFDPAVYYGHREMELAFTHLFGGFDSLFYHSYEENFPIAPGFEERIEIHNLYPLLVHVNLFGTSYLNGITHTLNRFA